MWTSDDVSVPWHFALGCQIDLVGPEILVDSKVTATAAFYIGYVTLCYPKFRFLEFLTFLVGWFYLDPNFLSLKGLFLFFFLLLPCSLAQLFLSILQLPRNLGFTSNFFFFSRFSHYGLSALGRMGGWASQVQMLAQFLQFQVYTC